MLFCIFSFGQGSVDEEGKIWYPTAVSRLSFLNQMTTIHIRLASNIDVSLKGDAIRNRLDLRDFTKILGRFV